MIILAVAELIQDYKPKHTKNVECSFLSAPPGHNNLPLTAQRNTVLQSWLPLESLIPINHDGHTLNDWRSTPTTTIIIGRAPRPTILSKNVLQFIRAESHIGPLSREPIEHQRTSKARNQETNLVDAQACFTGAKNAIFESPVLMFSQYLGLVVHQFPTVGEVSSHQARKSLNLEMSTTATVRSIKFDHRALCALWGCVLKIVLETQRTDRMSPSELWRLVCPRTT